MKRFLTLTLIALVMLFTLSDCGCDNDIQADLVFVNDSHAAIYAVVADLANQTVGAQKADSSPLKLGETFGFEVGEYPVSRKAECWPRSSSTRPRRKGSAGM